MPNMDGIIREALCGFVEDWYDRMILDKHTSRHKLMRRAETLSATPDVPKTRAGAIIRFMRENNISFKTMPGCETREESDRTIALIHAERREDKTIGYMRALHQDLGDCVSAIKKDRHLMRHISHNTGAAISRALHCLRADNAYICGGVSGPDGTGPLHEMEALHAENAAAMEAFAKDDHLPEKLSSETRHSLFFVTQMVNANHLLVMMDVTGALRE